MRSESMMAAGYAQSLANMDEGPFASERSGALTHPENYGRPDIEALIVESEKRKLPVEALQSLLPFAEVQIVVSISERQVRDLMCSAWEGGSNYWCGYKTTEGLTPEKIDAYRMQLTREGENDLTIYKWMHPFLDGVTLVMTDACGEGADLEQPWELNREKLLIGLQTMATKYPQHFNSLVGENDDAETGDVFLQCCLFGEIVFG